MTIAELIRQATDQLSDSSDSPRLDAELLLGTVTHMSRAQLYARNSDAVSADDEALFNELLAKRRQGMPVAHITGRRDFWTLSLKVTPDTLVPRPETEVLVEQALLHIPEHDACRVLDLGTGSGAIILAIGSERPHADLNATDFSADALAVAEDNAACCEHSVNWYQGSWFDALDDAQTFDVIISNPPYIGLDETNMTDPELEFEPDRALYSGTDGLDDISQIVAMAPDYLTPSGWLLIEHGLMQGDAIRQLFASRGFVEINTVFDLAGLPRVTSGRLPAVSH